MLDLAEALGLKIHSALWDGAGRVPYMLIETYDFRKITLDGAPCIFAEPRGDIPPVQTLLRNIERIREVEPLPVVLKLNGLSGERRKALIEARIPFVATEQIYLPFLGVALSERLYAEPKPREKLMPSAQLVLFSYLYQNGERMYTSGLADKLGLSAMQITRAVRQLQKLNLLEVSKEGVKVVVSGRTNHRALFEGANTYLLDPVREIIYVPRNERTQGLPYAGLDALAELSMLSAPFATTRAYYNRTDKLNGENSLTDREKQIRVEVWKYPPAVLSANPNSADPLSVIVSLRDERDERVEQAIEEALANMWR
ncbi:MAG: MarR family transcriptional regulator [Clostridiales Family XIII bacterium]|nr:MarR family transcriptional regulator [Clostridiales Family XIII bacterium]